MKNASAGARSDCSSRPNVEIESKCSRELDICRAGKAQAIDRGVRAKIESGRGRPRRVKYEVELEFVGLGRHLAAAHARRRNRDRKTVCGIVELLQSADHCVAVACRGYRPLQRRDQLVWRRPLMFNAEPIV